MLNTEIKALYSRKEKLTREIYSLQLFLMRNVNKELWKCFDEKTEEVIYHKKKLKERRLWKKWKNLLEEQLGDEKFSLRSAQPEQFIINRTKHNLQMRKKSY